MVLSLGQDDCPGAVECGAFVSLLLSKCRELHLFNYSDVNKNLL
jgi:hypothetical protein